MAYSLTVTCNQCQLQLHVTHRAHAISDHAWIYDGEQWLCDACYDTQNNERNPT